MAKMFYTLEETKSALGRNEDEIKQLAREGMTCILVTHEMRFARELAHEVIFTDGGKIVESAPPAELFDRPKQERTKAFLSQVL